MMLIAHSKKMTLTGEYAFIYTELIEAEAVGNVSWAAGTGVYNYYSFEYQINSCRSITFRECG